MGNHAASFTREIKHHAPSQFQVQSFECETVSSDVSRLDNRFPAESSTSPHLKEQGNRFSFLEFLYDTNKMQLQNGYASEMSSPAYPQNVVAMQSENLCLPQGHVTQVQTPQACYNQTRAPKLPFSKSDYNYVLGTIWGNVRKCFGCKREFPPASPLITSLFLSDTSVTGISIFHFKQ